MSIENFLLFISIMIVCCVGAAVVCFVYLFKERKKVFKDFDEKFFKDFDEKDFDEKFNKIEEKINKIGRR